MATSRDGDENSTTTLVLPRPAGLAKFARQLPGHDADVLDACARYFRAVAARDVEGVLETMTAHYGNALRQMRQWADFCAFFRLWCEAQGQLKRIISNHADGDTATVLADIGSEVVCLDLRRVDGKWLIDAERSGRRR